MLAQLGCGESSSQPPAESGKATTPGEPAAKSKDAAAPKPGDTAACTDYSTLDPATLPPLPESKFGEVLQQVWLKVLEKHYDPKLACKDWPALRLQYAERLVGVDEAPRAYAIINDMLGELGQSHFRLFPPDGGADEDQREGTAMPPMRVRWVDDGLVVVESHANGHLGAVAPGAALRSIDGEDFEAAIARVRSHTDRDSEFAFEIARVAEARLSCARAGQAKKVEIEEPGSDRKLVRMLTCTDAEGERVTLGNLENIPTRVEHRMVPGTTVGYLAFNVWMLPMVKRVETGMNELRSQGMTALVLDLRGNPGGVGAMSVPVARMLLQATGSLGKLQFRDFAQEFNVEGNPLAFAGPIALLVDEGTASTSEIFAAGLRDLDRVKVFGGRPSAGAALPSLIDELPGGAILQYVVGDYRSPKGELVEGVGVVPDVLVPEHRADFAAGHDPVLEAAIASFGTAAPSPTPTTSAGDPH